MTVIRQVHRCDWPGCERTIEIDTSHVAWRHVFRWEDRGDRWIVCPDHRFESYDALATALAEAEGRETP